MLKATGRSWQEWRALKSLRRREVGETADSGFQIGVQRTLPFPAPRVGEVLLSPRGLAAWLGRTGRLRLQKGARYRTREGASGELRSLEPGGYLRLTWQPAGWEKPSIFALRLRRPSCAGRTLADRPISRYIRPDTLEHSSSAPPEAGLGTPGLTAAAARGPKYDREE